MPITNVLALNYHFLRSTFAFYVFCPDSTNFRLVMERPPIILSDDEDDVIFDGSVVNGTSSVDGTPKDNKRIKLENADQGSPSASFDDVAYPNDQTTITSNYNDNSLIASTCSGYRGLPATTGYHS
ncbi:hypothetical protein RvY_01305-2 [Ramazzottius varieornatus]|uniref:Uncharacterized protein n=1 Tax=Ramazzottius varieornatus TaxID=947166 RepID=A0A1D1UGR3_RAMVA|nr:hypothetical protein RvY_01305-2 [Ramazzottius varieornatus]